MFLTLVLRPLRDCIAFGKLAVNLSHLTVGAKVAVEGKLRQNVYEKDGEKRYSVEVRADRVEFLSPKKKSGEAAPEAEASETANTEHDSDAPNLDDDDIPF